MAFIIFDFDGTLVDSFTCMIDKFINLADDFGFKKIETSQIDNLRNFSSLQIIRYLNIPFYKIPLVIRAARRLLKSSMPQLQPVDGLIPVLKALHKNGHILGIVTSNSEENVKTWLQLQDLTHLFKFIAAESKFFSKNKILKKVLKKNKIKATEAWYVGDETRDIEAGKDVGVRTIAITWGYNSESILKSYAPDALVHSPEEILEII